MNERPPCSEEERPQLTMVFLGLLITVSLVGLEIYLLRTLTPTISGRGWAVAAGCTLAYVVLGTIIHPQPDTSDMGYFGGLVDNPFSFRDDANRFLLFLQVILLPAKLVSWTVISAVRLFR